MLGRRLAELIVGKLIVIEIFYAILEIFIFIII